MNTVASSVLTSTLVIIDAGIEDYQTLVDGVVEGAAVVVLDRDRDGIRQITEILSQYPAIASLHVVSHGSPGCLYLGNTELSLSTIDRYSAQLKTWFFSSSLFYVTPSLLLYGCNIAVGDAGTELLETLHRLTGADTFASKTLTGSKNLGGNWNLEGSSSDAPIALAFFSEVLAAYPNVLANPIINAGLFDGQIFNSGYNGTGGKQAAGTRDAQWDVGVGTTAGPSSVSTWVDAYVTGNKAPGAWQNSPYGASEWISYNAAASHAGNLDVYFRYNFTLGASIDPSIFGLQLDFAADNDVYEIYVNGVAQSPTSPAILTNNSNSYPAPGYSNGNQLATTLLNNWQTGNNEIIIYVRSGAPQVGLDVQINPLVIKPILDLDTNNSSGTSSNFANTFTAGHAAANVVDSDIQITDNTANFNQATLQLTNAKLGDQFVVDTAALTALGITATPDTSVAGVITLTLSGISSLDNYRAALTTIKFANTQADPDNTDRNINVTVRDADNNVSRTAISTIHVLDDIAPTIDLNGAAAGSDFSATYTENGAAVAIASATTAVTDADNANIASASVTLTNPASGDLLSFNGIPVSNSTTGNATGITGLTFNVSADGSTLTFNGSATQAQYETVLKAIAFANTLDNPTGGNRAITVVVSDGLANSNTATSTIAVVPVNDAPAIDLNGAAAGTDYSTTLLGSSTPVAIADNTAATISDPDDTDINTLTLTFNIVPDGANEVLNIGGQAIALTNGTGTATVGGTIFAIAATSGTVTVTKQGGGDIPNADIQTLLRGITYQNNSSVITTGNRTISIKANDGAADSNIAIATIKIPPAPPTVTISEDANNDGIINAAELIGTVDVSVALPTDAVAGDLLTITDGTTPQTVTLSAADITAATVTTTFTAPASGSTLTVSAFVTDQSGNPGASGTDSAVIDTVAPSAPTVTISEDANNDGIINTAELIGAVDVSVALPTDAVAGDLLTITDGTTPQTVTLSAADITAATVTTTFTAPASGSTLTVSAFVTDQSGNAGTPGTDSAVIDTVAPSAPTVTISEDANNDGIINAAELIGTVDVSVALPTDAVAGDLLTITDGTTPQTVTLTAAQITAGTVTATFTPPASGSTLTISAFVTDQSGNPGASGTDSAVIDTVAPSAPTVTISEDANNDGIINAAELIGAVDVSVALPTDAVAGDLLTITDGTTPQTVTLSAADITAATVTTTFTAPASGSTLTVSAFVTDQSGNAGTPGTDSAVIDTVAPSAPIVTISEDANNDGIINAAELIGTVDVSVALPTDAVAGDLLTITDGTTPQTVTLTAAQITAGTVTANFTPPASGTTLTISAFVTDQSGNAGTPGTDSAVIDTVAPSAPIVTISEDANNDGIINTAELIGAVDVSVALPTDAVAGDLLTITDGTTPQTVTLSAADITAATVTTTFTAPASGSTLTVSAFVTDQSGNPGASGTDSAVIDTVAPSAPIVTISEDANNDGIINAAELIGTVDVSVALPTDAVAGDLLTITDGTTPQTVTLSAADITAATVTTTFTAPASGSTLTVSAFVTDQSGNAGTPGTDSAVIDTVAPSAPTVTISEDANNDGIINAAELIGAVDVSVALPTDAVAGDLLTITDGTTPQTVTLTAAQITAGTVTATFTPPASGTTLTISAFVTDQSGNPGASGTDSAVIDTVAPSAPTVTISEDANNDGIINTAELIGAVDVSVALPTDAVAGDLLTITDGTTPQTVTLSAADITAATVTTTFTAPASGSTLTVSAFVTDQSGNAGTPGTDSAVIDTVAPSAPTVTISEDANNDGIINAAELIGTVDVSVALPTDAVAGDLLTITDGTTPQTVTLTAAQITAGTVTANFTPPASGTTLTISAFVTDQSGNAGTPGTDSAVIDTVAPSAPTVTISEDANNDGIINAAELIGAVNVSVALPTDAVAGDLLTITDGTTPQTVTLSAADITAATVTTTFTAPASGSTLTVSAFVTDQSGNPGASGTDSAVIDTVAPSAPTVTISEDANNDGIINTAELIGAVDVSVALPTDAVAGDLLTITDGTTPQTVTLSAADITAATVTTTFTAPASGSTLTVSAFVTDQSGNAGTPGTDSAVIDTVAPSAPIVTISEDANNDGIINAAELIGTVDVSVALPTDAVAGDLLTITDGTTPQTVTLTAAQITAGTVTATFTPPASGSTLTISAFVTDQSGNPGASGTDSAVIDTVAPSAPTVTISEDANNDGIINAAELIGAVDVSVALPTDAVAGDLLTITDGTTPQTVTLSAADITAATVTTTFTAPASGSTLTVSAFVTDQSGNAGTPGTDSAVIDTVAPSAPIVTISEDANNDGIINAAELIGTVDVSVALPTDAVAGDLLTITDGTTPQTVTLTAAQITAGTVTANFTPPASGTTLTISAFVTDQSGNAGTPGTDSAVIDTVAPSAPTVTISEDANNDGIINTAELIGAVNVSVALPTDAVAGDLLTITDGTTPQTVTLSAADITAATVTTTFTAPASGSTLTVSAFVTDQSGNPGASGTDSAVIDTVAPSAPIVTISEDANNDGIINAAELIGTVDVSVALPTDAVAGDLLTITDGTTPQTVTLSAADITAATVTTTFTAPASGSTLTVSAFVTDQSGNAGTPGTDSAVIDTVAPSAPTVTISEDANNDGIINAAELIGAVDVSVALPTDAVAGDLLTITDGTTPQTVTLTAAQITAGTVTATFTPPASGTTLTISAFVTDQSGNPGASGTDSAVIDTVAPSAPTVTISEDANNDGIINTAELIGAVDVSVALPTDAVAGDLLTITDGTTPQTVTLSAADITAATVTTTFTAPASGSTLTVSAFVTDQSGNAGTPGTDSAVIDTVAPSAPIVTISEDANNDGIINAAELIGTVDVSVALPTDAVAGDLLTITDGTTPQTVTLTAAQITAGTVTATFTPPASGSTLTISAFVTDQSGNPGASGTDSAVIDTVAPSAPIVTISEDANNDGIINAAELIGTVNVSVALPTDAVAGDLLTITDGTTPQTVTLSAADITAATVTTTFTAPASGSTLTVSAFVTDQSGNPGASGTDSAVIDTVAPSAPTVTISEDANNDGIINAAELIGTVDVSVALPTDAVAGDLLTITDGTTPQTVTLSAADITAATVTTTFTAPASGSTLTVSAFVTDQSGNPGASGTDSAVIDTVAPSAPTVTISEDANNDGIINTAELIGAVDVSVALPTDAVAGDLLTITDGTTPQTVTLSAADITAATVTTTFTAPASGSTLTVSAFVTDQSGNPGASGTDSAVIDTVAPSAPIVTISEDANNDGIINAAELIGTVDVSVALPTDAVAGDLLTITDGTTPQTVTLTAAQITAGTVTATFTPPASGSTLTISAFVTDQSGNPGASGTDSAVIDTVAPSAPIVTISEDANNDGIINAAELIGTVDVSVALPTDAVAGDLLTITDGTTPQTVTLSAADITAATVTTTFTAPASGSTLTVSAFVTDQSGNPGASGTDSAVIDTVAPSAPTVTISEDANNDGIINTAELIGAVDVSVALPTDAVAGDLLTITDGTTPQTVTLSAADITAATVTTTFTAPASGSTLTVSAFVTDQSGNPGASGTDSAVIDTVAPSAPTVTISEDANNDGIINAAELIGAVDVSVALPTDAVAGDLLTITDGTTPQTVTLTAAQITAGTVTATFTPPASGSTLTISAFVTDQSGNPGASGTDSAVIDTVAPSAPIVTISEDANNDGIINAAELIGTVDVSVALPTDAVAGDLLTITDGTTPQTVTLSAADITAATVTTTFTAPASGSTLTVSAFVTDQSGNAGTPGTDSAVIDTVAPSAPTVTISEDANNDGIINAAELIGAVDVSVALPTDAVAGDLLTITDGTTPQTVTLTAAQITAGTVTANFTPPASGTTLTISAFVTDQSGNAGTPGTDSAVIDTVAPSAPIVTISEDANNDGIINAAELIGTVDVSVALPTDAVAGDLLTITDGTTPQTVTLTAAQITAGTVTTTFTPPASGSTLTISAFITDQSGNAGTPGTDSALIDTTAPVVSVDPLLTNDSTPKLTGKVDDPTAVVTVTINGQTYSATNNGDGTWTLADNAIATALADGTYDVTAIATAAAGNVGTEATTQELSIDATAPTVTVGLLVTKDATPQLTGTVSDPAAAVKVTVSGQTYTATNNGDGTWTLADNTIATPLPDGKYDISVTATDASGNLGSDTTTNELTIDTTAPIVTVKPASTNDSTPKLIGTVDDPTAGVTVTINGQTYTATNNGDGTWTLADNTIATALADGTYDVTVVATDPVGNVGTDPTSQELVINSKAPIVTVDLLSTNDATPQITGTVSDPTAAVKLTVNGQTYTATNNGDGTWVLPDNAIALLPDGIYEVAASASDLLGNTGTDATLNELTLDATAPVISVDPLITIDNTPQLSGKVDDPTAGVSVTINGQTYAATNNGDGTWTLPDDVIPSPLPDGTYDVVAVAIDAFGNAGTDTTTQDLTVSVNPPIVSIDLLTTADQTPKLTGKVSDPQSVVTITLNGQNYTATNNGDGTWTLPDDTVTTPLPNGTYDVGVTATNKLGKTGTDSTSNELTITLGNQAPIAQDANNSVTPGKTVAVSGLGATDSDGSIVSYTILSLPDATQGSLFLGDPATGGSAVAAGQVLTPTQVNQLFFRASSSFSAASLTYTATDNQEATDSSPATASFSFGNLPPVSVDFTPAAPIAPGAIVPLPGLSATDPDGTVVSYTITSLPDATQGTLYLGDPRNGGTLVSAGQVISPQAIAQLFFKAASSFTGTAFTYTTTDNTGAIDPKGGRVTLGVSRVLEEYCPNQPGVIRSGGRRKNTLVGTDNRDRLVGKGGNDNLKGGASTDILLGGSGKDKLFGGSCSDLLRGGTGNDKLRGGTGNDKLRGDRGNDKLWGDSGNDKLWGGQGNDQLKGGTGDDKLSGGLGKDRLYGNAGNDQLSGGRGNDRLKGNSGNDKLSGGLGNDKLLGGSGNDKLSGGRGNDTLKGGTERDRLVGNRGDDWLGGGKGNDMLKGGIGNDRLWGGRGQDVLQGGTGNDRLLGRQGNDKLDGGRGNDVLKGDGGRDTLKGKQGNDVLLGGNQSDKLVGGSGDDQISGNHGADVLIGGFGHDLLSGGQGNDRFVYNNPQEKGDRITDFKPNQDAIDLSGILSKKQFVSAKPFRDYIKLIQSGASTIVQLDANGKAAGGFETLVTLDNVAANRLNADSFIL